MRWVGSRESGSDQVNRCSRDIRYSHDSVWSADECLPLDDLSWESVSGTLPPPPVTVTIHWTTNTFTSSPRARRAAAAVAGRVPATAGSFDPNAMIGPSGYGPSNFVSGAAQTRFPYQIDFENSPTATAPAQQVVITDTLDPNLDLSTFQLTEIAFGDTVLTIPPGSQDYQTTVPMTYNGVDLQRGRQREPGLRDAGIDRDVPVDRSGDAIASEHPGRLPAPRGRHRPRRGLRQLFDRHRRPACRPARRSPTWPISPSTAISRSPPTRSARPIPARGSRPPSRRWSRSTTPRPPAASPRCRPRRPRELHRELVRQRRRGLRHRQIHGVLQHGANGSSTFGPYQTLLVNTTKTSTTFTGQAGAHVPLL